MSEQGILLWRQRYAALKLELSGVEDPIAAKKEHGYAYSVDFI